VIPHGVSDGPDDAASLVLSSSLGTTLAMWEPQVAPLAEQLRVVRYDHRGHGRSPVPDGPYSVADLGGDVLELADALGLARFSFCGLSLGGLVGMWIASEAPERVERLVLCCTAPSFPPAEQWLDRAATVRAEGTEAIADALLGRWFTPAADTALVERFRAMLAATPREGYAGCCEALAGADLDDRLSAIDAPTLVVNGADDVVAPPQRGAALAAAIPGAHHVVVPGAHVPTAEHPARFTDHVLAHLTEETA
jgi:3-oxoadipate enol-lactonase